MAWSDRPGAHAQKEYSDSENDSEPVKSNFQFPRKKPVKFSDRARPPEGALTMPRHIGGVSSVPHAVLPGAKFSQ